MTRGTAKTLRVLGIVFTTLFTLIACGILLLLSLCAGLGNSSRQNEQAIPFLIGAVVALAAGIGIIVVLAKAIMRSNREEVEAYRNSLAGNLPPGAVLPPPPALSGPLQISDAGQKAIDLVVFAICGSFLFTLISWGLNFQRVVNGRAQFRGWLMILAISIVLYYIPYAAVLISFFRKPSRYTFYYAVTVPAIQALFSLFTVASTGYFYSRAPMALLLVLISWGIDVAILVLAWRAMRANSVQPDSAALVFAAVAPFFYFLVVRFVSPLLYTVVRR